MLTIPSNGSQKMEVSIQSEDQNETFHSISWFKLEENVTPTWGLERNTFSISLTEPFVTSLRET